MIESRKLKINSLIIIPVLIGLIFSFTLNGYYLLSGDQEILFKYLNILNSATQAETYPNYFVILFYLTGGLQLVAALALIGSLVNRDFIENRPSSMLKWGLFVAIFSITVYGFMLRVISNHGGSANLYFYMSLLYFLLWFVERGSSKKNNVLFNGLKFFPILITVFYTMGHPGWQKIVNTAEVMDKYEKMFSKSFLAQLPGGIPPFIYFLGILELAVTVLLIISLVKRELIMKKTKVFLNSALLLTISTFIILSFGLALLLNYQGSTNLIFYAIFTLGLYLYVNAEHCKYP